MYALVFLILAACGLPALLASARGIQARDGRSRGWALPRHGHGTSR
jgi:hypothetical protein